MEFVLELIFEIFIEGIFEVCTSKKVPKPLRILASVLFGIVYGVILAVIFQVALDVMKSKSTVLGWMFIAVDVLLIWGIIHVFRKKGHK